MKRLDKNFLQKKEKELASGNDYLLKKSSMGGLKSPPFFFGGKDAHSPLFQA